MFALFDAAWMAERFLLLSARGINLLEYVLYERITSVTDARLLHDEDSRVLAETMTIMKTRILASALDESRKTLLDDLIRAIGNAVAHLESMRSAAPPTDGA